MDKQTSTLFKTLWLLLFNKNNEVQWSSGKNSENYFVSKNLIDIIFALHNQKKKQEHILIIMSLA